MTRKSALAVAACWALSVPGAAAAQGWDDYLAPDAVRGERLLAHAMEHVACALETDECVPDVDTPFVGPEVEWEQALIRLDRALRYLPDDPDVLLFRAIALARYEHDDGDGIIRRVADAIEAFEHLRRVHPEVAPGMVAFEMAILRTRERDYRGAAEEYARLAEVATLLPVVPFLVPHTGAIPFRPLFARLGEHFLSTPVELAYGNWAEVTMLAGDAERATELYALAIEVERGHWPNEALGRFGLALALERAGAHDAAIAAVHEALDVEVPADDESRSARSLVARFGSFAPLHAEGVFFEPECEIRAYEALGNEALAAEARSAEGRRARLESALRAWRAFLSEGGREGLWAARAEEAIARLEARLAE